METGRSPQADRGRIINAQRSLTADGGDGQNLHNGGGGGSGDLFLFRLIKLLAVDRLPLRVVPVVHRAEAAGVAVSI